MCGGIETAVMNYYRHIDRNKIQFDFLCTFGDIKQLSVEQFYENEATMLGARVFKLHSGMNPMLNPAYLHSFIRVIKKNSDIKIIHIHGSSPGNTALRAFLARIAGLTIRIVHSHNVHNLSLARTMPRPFLRFFATHWLACSLKAGRSLFGQHAFDKEVAKPLSEGSAAGIHSLAIKKNKAFLFPNAFNLELFRFNPEIRLRVRDELNLGNMFVLLHVARLHPQKNQGFLLEAFSLAVKTRPEMILLIAGDGKLRAELEKKASDLQITDKVRFLGVRKDVSDLLQAADIFVLPSLYEGLGIVAIEAQTAGLPCLLSDTITKEVKVTDLVEFVAIDRGAQIWAERLLDYHYFNRQDTLEDVHRAGYDIHAAAERLLEFYLTSL